MNNIPLRTLAAGLAAALALAACGGSDGDNKSDSGSANYATVLAQLNTPAGMTSADVAAVFDNGYLDSGTTKNQTLDALSGEAAALTAHSDHSVFPQVTLDNVSLSGCDANNVCTLTGTLHNNDADDTTVQFTTKVVSTGNGAYRLFGDQLAS